MPVTGDSADAGDSTPVIPVMPAMPNPCLFEAVPLRFLGDSGES